MIDLHSHLLPAIDDGSRSVKQSLRVLSLFTEQGIKGVALTPHVRASDMALDPEDPIEQRAMAFAELRNGSAIELALYLGFEIMMDEPLPDRAFEDTAFALGDSSYFLIEFPLAVDGSVVTDMVEHIVEKGGRPLIAHAERYYECGTEAVAEWRRAGAVVQVDATTLTQPSSRGHRARQLLGLGLADIIAADNHGNRRSLLTGIEYLSERGGADQATLLATVNPGAIVNDQSTTPVPPLVIRESIVERLKRLKNG